MDALEQVEAPNGDWFRSGHTTCYERGSSRWSALESCPTPYEECPATAGCGQDGTRRGGLELTELDDGRVTDAATGLTWAAAPGWGRMGYGAALTFCRQQGMRVPTISELATLANYGDDADYFPPVSAFQTLDPDVFAIELGTDRVSDCAYPFGPGTDRAGCGDWTNHRNEPVYYGFHFDHGRPFRDPPRGSEFYHDGLHAVICVAGESPWASGPAPVQLIDNGNGTFADPRTGLEWQRLDPSTPRTYAQAIDDCAALSDSVGEEWHLANIKEAISLLYPIERPQGMANYVESDYLMLPAELRVDNAKYWTSTPEGAGTTRILQPNFMNYPVSTTAMDDTRAGANLVALCARRVPCTSVVLDSPTAPSTCTNGCGFYTCAGKCLPMGTPTCLACEGTTQVNEAACMAGTYGGLCQYQTTESGDPICMPDPVIFGE